MSNKKYMGAIIWGVFYKVVELNCFDSFFHFREWCSDMLIRNLDYMHDKFIRALTKLSGTIHTQSFLKVSKERVEESPMILLEPCFVEKVLVFNDGLENVDEILVVVYHPVFGKLLLKVLVVVLENPESSLGLFNTFQMKLGVDDVVRDFLWKISLLQNILCNSGSGSHDNNRDFRTIEKVCGMILK